MTLKTFEKLSGETWRIRRFSTPMDKRWSAFNPSIAYSPVYGYVVLFRSSNYFFDPETGSTVATIGNKVLNRMFMGKLDKDWQIIEETLKEIDFSGVGKYLRGPEDGRLYWRDGHWEILSVMREPHITNDIPRLATYKIVDNKAELIKIHTDGDLQPVEKNWMPAYKKNPKFDFVYSATSVYVDGVGKQLRREASGLVGNAVRGGSCLWELEDGSYLSIIHECTTRTEKVYSARRFGMIDFTKRSYLHRFAKYSSDGMLVGLSDLFTFSGVDIEFAAGLVVSNDDVIVSYGYKDVASYLGKIKLKAVLEMIKNV